MNKVKLIGLSLGIFMVLGLSLVTTNTALPAEVNAVEPAGYEAVQKKIGLLTPLTGALGSLGVTFVTAANLAIADLNKKYNGTTACASAACNFTLVVQDTQSSDTATTAAATALASAGVLGVAGAARSAGTIAATAVLSAQSIPLISYASTSPSLSNLTDSGFTFRVVPSDALQGIAAAKLVQFAGITSVATIGIDDAYGQGLVNAFLDNSGLTPLARVDYDLTQTVFTTDATTLINQNPGAIYMASFIDDGAAILNALQAQGFTGPIIGADGIASPTMFAIAGVNASMNLVMGTAPTFAATSDFTAKYNKAIGNDPTIFVAEAYDAVMMIGEAIANATASTSTAVRDALVNTVGKSYSGASSANITFDSNGDLIGGNYDVWQVQTTAGTADLVVTGNFNPNTGVLTIWDNMLQTDWPATNTNVVPAPTTTTTTTTTTSTTPGQTTVTSVATTTETASPSVSTVTESPLSYISILIGMMSAGIILRLRKRN